MSELTTHGEQGLVLKQASMQTDKAGLSTGSATFTYNLVGAESVGPMPRPNGGDAHPKVAWLLCEKRNLTWGPGLATIQCEFAGLDPDAEDDTEPVFELNIGSGEVPIQLHPAFVTDLGGSPSAPLNGAIWVDSQGRATADDDVGIFERFAITSDLKGVESFFDSNNVTWRMRYTSRYRPTDGGTVASIDTPQGDPPSFGNDRNWLYSGMTYSQRAGVFSVSKEWRLSLRGGWNALIYT